MSLSKIIIALIGIFLISACCSQKNVASYNVKNTLWRNGAYETLHLKCNGRYKVIIVNHLLGGKNSIRKGEWKVDGDTLTLQRKDKWNIDDSTLAMQKRKRPYPYIFSYFLIDDKANLYKLAANESGKLELTESYWYATNKRRLFPRCRKRPACGK